MNLQHTAEAERALNESSNNEGERDRIAEATLQALLGIYASQPEEILQNDSMELQADRSRHRTMTVPWTGVHRPTNHPMATQCTIDPTGLTLRAPRTDKQEENHAVANVTEQAHERPQSATDGNPCRDHGNPRDTSHVEYLMAGSDQDDHVPRRKAAGGAQGPLPHPSRPADARILSEDEDSDEAERTSPLS